MKRTRLRVFLAALIGLPSLLAVILMASRVGDTARFVTWPVVGFTALAAGVAVLGVWAGAHQPSTLVVGLLPALVVSYFLPAAPFPLVFAALLAVGVATAVARGVACGVAAGTGTLMVVFVVLPGPAVECGESSVSANSGPLWIAEPSQTSGDGVTSPDGRSDGTTEVGGRRYRYSCVSGRLASFNRLPSRS